MVVLSSHFIQYYPYWAAIRNGKANLLLFTTLGYAAISHFETTEEPPKKMQGTLQVSFLQHWKRFPFKHKMEG